jgi:hypothetical protein
MQAFPYHPLLSWYPLRATFEHDRVHLSSVTVVLLPVRPLYRGTQKHYWQLKMCSNIHYSTASKEQKGGHKTLEIALKREILKH